MNGQDFEMGQNNDNKKSDKSKQEILTNSYLKEVSEGKRVFHFVLFYSDISGW